MELAVSDKSLYKIRIVTPNLTYAKDSLVWVSDKNVGKYIGADISRISLQGEEKRINEILKDTNAYLWIIKYYRKYK